jgi:hypothetical protein
MLTNLRIARAETGEATLVDGEGRELLDFVPLGASGTELAALLARLEAALAAPALPRVAVGYREGLIEAVTADIPCEVVLLEEDPFDEPSVSVRRRVVTAGDPEATSLVIARGEAAAARRA